MHGVMIQLSVPEGPPSLTSAAALLGLDLADLDPEFGVIPTDPDAGLYTVRVAMGAVARAEAALQRRAVGGPEGIFSDPKIAPFGPPDD